jgi:hypothetical protein
MKRGLIAGLLALVLTLVVAAQASAAVGDVTVPTVGGTLYFNTAGTSHFDFGAPIPVAQTWAGQTWDSVTSDWQNLHVHYLVCVDLTLDIPTPGDYGVHCSSFDVPVTSANIEDVALNLTSKDFDLSAAGMSAFPATDTVEFGGAVADPPLLGALPDLDPYVGQVLTGHFRVRSESWAYYGTWPSNQSVTTLGYFGTTADVRTTSATKTGAPKPPTWGSQKFKLRVQPTADDCRVPWVRGKTLRAAKKLLREHNCRVGAIRHAHGRSRLRGRVLRAGTYAGHWFPRHHRVALIVGK